MYDMISVHCCVVCLQVCLGSTWRRQCYMKANVAPSVWSLCWLNSVRVSFVNMGSRRRAFSGRPDRPTMCENCRMHLTVGRSQCLTGEVTGGSILSITACQTMIHVRKCSVMWTLCLLQYHRCPHSGVTPEAVYTGAT